MRVRNPLSAKRTAARRSRGGGGHWRAAPATTEAPAPDEAKPDLEADRRSPDRLAADRRERLVRESGGPQDQALYGCSCGYQFSATVGTAVVCPNCGAEQAW